jgi:hypothetical protein
MSLIKKFDSIKGAKYITINGYKSKSAYVEGKPQIANHTINVNVNTLKAKQDDLVTLKNFKASDLIVIADRRGADLGTALKAVEEMITSKEKNLNGEKSKGSQAQIDAYIPLGKGLKIHKETEKLHITGFANNKTILVEGEYKHVNSAPKTLIKKDIEKTLRMSKYRTFVVSNADSISITGDTVQTK